MNKLFGCLTALYWAFVIEKGGERISEKSSSMRRAIVCPNVVAALPRSYSLACCFNSPSSSTPSHLPSPPQLFVCVLGGRSEGHLFDFHRPLADPVR